MVTSFVPRAGAALDACNDWPSFLPRRAVGSASTQSALNGEARQANAAKASPQSWPAQVGDVGGASRKPAGRCSWPVFNAAYVGVWRIWNVTTCRIRASFGGSSDISQSDSTHRWKFGRCAGCLGFLADGSEASSTPTEHQPTQQSWPPLILLIVACIITMVRVLQVESLENAVAHEDLNAQLNTHQLQLQRHSHAGVARRHHSIDDDWLNGSSDAVFRAKLSKQLTHRKMEVSEMEHDESVERARISRIQTSLANERARTKELLRMTRENATVTELQRMLTKQNSTMTELQRSHAEQHSLMVKLALETNTTRNRAATLKRDLKQANAHTKTLEQERRKIKGKLHEQTKAATKLQHAFDVEVPELAAEVTRLGDEAKALALQKQHAQNQLKQEQVDGEEKLNEMRAKIADAERARRKAERQALEMQQKRDGEDSQERVSEVKEQMHEQEKATTRATAQAQRALQASEKRRWELQEMLRTVMQKRTLAATKAGEVRAVETKAEEMQKRYEDEKPKTERLEEEVSSLKAQLDQQRNALEAEEAQQRTKQAETELAQQRARSAEAQLAQQRLQLSGLNKELEDEQASRRHDQKDKSMLENELTSNDQRKLSMLEIGPPAHSQLQVGRADVEADSDDQRDEVGQVDEGGEPAKEQEEQEANDDAVYVGELDMDVGES